ncbi:hypothetical protein TeGR_g10729 [Tetraparma gracilis]|uniref:Glutaredoxin domain-containing protein n=1 Tax=Tetraparma gracilis TaxID=2962635 RepID=A0ABQ6M5H8_9STRA|nr:hypothetical protein TeGR_g10729 [Tetraparma gracilis]
MLSRLLLLLLVLPLASSFLPPAPFRSPFSLRSSSGENLRPDFVPETAASTAARIQSLVSANPVCLFMKGNKMFPQCGFSNTAVQILQTYGIDFHTVDVLADPDVREGVKAFADWPTIPQLYVAGEFVGGADIMIEEYQNGNLAETIEKAKAEML